MDLSLSDEQKQLQDAAERFVRDKYAFENRRKIAATERSTSASSVDQFDTEILMAALPRHVVPLIQQMAPCCTRSITRRV